MVIVLEIRKIGYNTEPLPYWEDDDKADTYVGSLKSDEYYTLKLMILKKHKIKVIFFCTKINIKT